MKILLVEDDSFLASAVRIGLNQHGIAVDWIVSDREFDLALRGYPYDCVLLDLGLPGVNGEALLKRMRDARDGRPIIVITARSQVCDRVDMLNLGADDYMVKPFDLAELAARVRALVRRCDSKKPPLTELECGPIKLCASSRTVTVYGDVVALTKKEFWLLEAFMRKKNQVVSRAQLEQTLYGWGEEVNSNAVEVYVHHLRRKFSFDLIHTVRGEGYMLHPEL